MDLNEWLRFIQIFNPNSVIPKIINFDLIPIYHIGMMITIY
jgi:hypothetical protein